MRWGKGCPLGETPGDVVDLGKSGSSTSLDTNSSIETNMIDSGWRYDENIAKKDQGRAKSFHHEWTQAEWQEYMGNAMGSGQTSVGPATDTADTLPMESEDAATWPPKPWIPKSDISRWTTTKNPQAS